MLFARVFSSSVREPGADAIRRAATFPPNIALLGVVMPEMDSVEAAIKLLENCPGTKIVLVVFRFEGRVGLLPNPKPSSPSPRRDMD